MDDLLSRSSRLIALCTERGWKAAVAESCTGGLIAHRIACVPGASAVFQGGIVAYANEVKIALLGVSEADLSRYGAVSETVARAMAAGARLALHAECAVAVTGIAGPSGGTPKKPVGTVFIAAASPEDERLIRVCFPGDRRDIMEQTAETALALLIDILERP